MYPSIFRDLIDCYSLILAFRHYQHDFEIPDSQEEVHPSIFRDLIDCYSIFLAFRHYQHDFDVYYYALLESLDVNWMMCFPLTCLLHCFEVFLPNLK